MKLIFCAGVAFISASSATAAAAPLFELGSDYLAYSDGRGRRHTVSIGTSTSLNASSKFRIQLTAGERSAGGAHTRAARLEGLYDRRWDDRLSTHSAVAVASNGSIFARTQLVQDASYKLRPNLIGTIGARYSTYRRSEHVAGLSGGLTAYFRGASVSYRFTHLESNRLGSSHVHLASIRVPDQAGSTQLWASRGTSLYDTARLEEPAPGSFGSVAAMRTQKLTGGLGLKLGINRTWYRTPNGRFHGTGATAGISFSALPFGL